MSQDSTYDPLTPSQEATLKQIEAQPLRISVSELISSQQGRDVQYLVNAGFLHGRVAHVSQDNNLSIHEYRRSPKSR